MFKGKFTEALLKMKPDLLRSLIFPRKQMRKILRTCALFTSFGRPKWIEQSPGSRELLLGEFPELSLPSVGLSRPCYVIIFLPSEMVNTNKIMTLP